MADRGRVIDEQVALRTWKSLVKRPPGPAVARWPAADHTRGAVVLRAAQTVLARRGPDQLHRIQASLITQAVTAQGKVQAVGVCDTPIGRRRRSRGVHRWRCGEPRRRARAGRRVRARYGGLNHLGWIGPFGLDGTEMIGDLISRFGELQQTAPHLAAFDADLVRRVGAIPTEYVYY